ncbi:hypothetical protein AX14_012270 [Amanita brunnescens Koide BX004]|nr:hypothetical protein AX14_012270 [Amanita brunnescens Koide BX004]
MTHLFLGYRIYRLTKSKLLYGFICIFATVVFALGITCGIRAWIIYVADGLSVLDTLVTCWLSLQSGLDLIISGIMVTRLYTSRTSYRQTNTVIYRLMRASVQTGIFCTVFAMGDMISFLAMPQSNLFGMFAFPIGRIYTNTLMETLNMREALKDLLGEPRVSTFRLASTTSRSHSLSLPQAKEGAHNGADHVVVNATMHGQSDFSTEAHKKIASVPSNSSLVSSEGRPKVDRESKFI